MAGTMPNLATKLDGVALMHLTHLHLTPFQLPTTIISHLKLQPLLHIDAVPGH
jgi:hypothetical protein